MINFNANSIYYRLLEKLQQDPDWQVIAHNSVITSLLKSDAEVLAEVARYAEYMFKESKWDTAQNSSSILSHAGLLGYQPKRKISARGKIYVSTDPRTHLVGQTISGSWFKNLKASNSSNWICPPRNLQILSSCPITDNNGVSYIASPLRFEKNQPYAILDIMQGSRKTIVIDIDTIRATATRSKLDPYLYIPMTIRSCEDASNNFSKAYFRVYVISTSNGGQTLTYTEYRVVNSLLLSSQADRDVEVYNDLYNQELFYFKFNNDPLRGSTLDLSQNSGIVGLRVDYVETLGAEGNLTHTYENFVVENVNAVDNTGILNTKLYGVNLEAIIGGQDAETSAEVKVNAPKFYINNYTAGTKEAYEKTIANMEFTVDGLSLKPKKVQVYKGSQTSSSGLSQDVTCISFLADKLEDLVTSNNKNADTYTKIDDALNYYLSRLKSPQDILTFVPPTYIPFAIGLTLTLSKDSTTNVGELIESIRNYVDDSWGPSSNDLDFSRSFYPSRIAHEILTKYPDDVKACKTEVEAIKKLDWSQAERIEPRSETGAAQIIHTCRIPFDFNNVFYGAESTKGFKDHRVGADYVMRFDFMYKKPKNMSSVATYHTSLFIQETDERRTTDAFYLISDTNNNNTIWPTSFDDNAVYQDLRDISQLTTAWQFRYRDSVYSDDEFKNLTDESSQAYIPTLKTYLTDPGTIDDYLIYFSAGYDKDKSSIGEGFLEISFDPIYRMLATFALYDSNLSTNLQSCQLALLKCGNLAEGSSAFDTFIELVSQYVDIYVSMRPIDEDLVIDSTNSINNNSVLYIDSTDSDSSTGTVGNISSDKRPRMISIKYKYGE